MRALVHRWCCRCALTSAALLASSGVAQVGSTAPEVVGPAYRRVHVDQRQPLTQDEIARRAAAGKATELDPATGELVVRTFQDRLPEGWLAGAPAGGERVDSFGAPIVNDTPGLPAWAQRDVDALRGAITQ